MTQNSEHSRNLLYKKKSHRYSHGFIRRRSTVSNASPHCNSAVIIKLDILNFFPTISADKVACLFRRMGLKDSQAKTLVNLCCWKNALPQGAPTSPALSNLIMEPIDEELWNLAIRYEARYTRYADDLTFSLSEDKPEAIRSLIGVTRSILASHGFKLNFKKGKIRVLRQHQHQEICGITVNTDTPTLSRKKRRLLRAAKHRLENQQVATMSKAQVSGWDSYIQMIADNS